MSTTLRYPYSPIRDRKFKSIDPIHCPAIYLMHTSKRKEIMDHLLPLYHCETLKSAKV